MPWRDLQKMSPYHKYTFCSPGREEGLIKLQGAEMQPCEYRTPCWAVCSTAAILWPSQPEVMATSHQGGTATADPAASSAHHTERQGQSPAKSSVVLCLNSLPQPTESICLLLQNARQRSQKHPYHWTPPKQTNTEYSDLQKGHIHFQLSSFPNDEHAHKKYHDKENPHEKPVHHFCNFFPLNSFGPVCFMVSNTISNILNIFNQHFVTRTAINVFTMNSIAFIPISIELLLEIAVIIPSGKRTPYLFVPPLTPIIPL